MSLDAYTSTCAGISVSTRLVAYMCASTTLQRVMCEVHVYVVILYQRCSAAMCEVHVSVVMLYQRCSAAMCEVHVSVVMMYQRCSAAMCGAHVRSLSLLV